MKIRLVKEFSARTADGGRKLIAPDTVLDLSEDKAKRLVSAGIALDLDALGAVWRKYMEEAELIYRASLHNGGSGVLCSRHVRHLEAARTFSRAGNIPALRAELDQALAALRSPDTV